MIRTHALVDVIAQCPSDPLVGTNKDADDADTVLGSVEVLLLEAELEESGAISRIKGRRRPKMTLLGLNR